MKVDKIDKYINWTLKKQKTRNVIEGNIYERKNASPTPKKEEKRIGIDS